MGLKTGVAQQFTYRLTSTFACKTLKKLSHSQRVQNIDRVECLTAGSGGFTWFRERAEFAKLNRFLPAYLDIVERGSIIAVGTCQRAMCVSTRNLYGIEPSRGLAEIAYQHVQRDECPVVGIPGDVQHEGSPLLALQIKASTEVQR